MKTQAPIILMSQKRGAERDRLEAEIDHEVIERAEFAIRQVDERLHEIEKLLAKAPREPSSAQTFVAGTTWAQKSEGWVEMALYLPKNNRLWETIRLLTQ